MELESRIKTPIAFKFEVRTRKLRKMRWKFTHLQNEENSYLHTS